MEDSHRSVNTKPVRQEDKFQNGDSADSLSSSQGQRLYADDKLKGCILPNPNLSFLPEVSLLQSWGKGVSVQGALLRSDNVSAVFTRVFIMVLTWAHSQGIRLLRYLDNWLVVAGSRERLIQDRDRLLQFCHSLGIVVNVEKSNLIPSQRILYMEMVIDSAASRVFPSEQRIDKFRTVALASTSEQTQSAK